MNISIYVCTRIDNIMQAYPIDTHECAKHDFVLKSQSVFDAKRNLGPDNETKK